MLLSEAEITGEFYTKKNAASKAALPFRLLSKRAQRQLLMIIIYFLSTKKESSKDPL